MFKIFLCHRTTDSRYASAHIYLALAAEFGRENIFEYNDNMPAGVNFRQHVVNLLQDMQVFIPLIGETWVDNKDDQDRLRLFQLDDPVRIEVETALSNKKLRVIPVLLDYFPCPKKNRLPKSIKTIVDKSAISIGFKPDDLKRGITKLVEEIKTAGVYPRPDPVPEIRRLKNELLQLEPEKMEKEKVHRRKSIIRGACVLAIPISVFVGIVCLMVQTKVAFFVLYTLSILLLLACGGLLLYNPKKIKAAIAQIETKIRSIKSQLINLEDND